MSFCAVVYESFKCIDEDDLDLNHENGYDYWLHGTRELLNAGEQRVA